MNNCDELNKHVLYFLKLPEGDIIKVGVAMARRLFNRIDEAQRFFSNKVEYLGIKFCDSKAEAHRKEKELRRNFGVKNSGGRDLLYNHKGVHEYIKQNCTYIGDEEVSPYVAKGRRIEKEKRNRKNNK